MYNFRYNWSTRVRGLIQLHLIIYVIDRRTVCKNVKCMNYANFGTITIAIFFIRRCPGLALSTRSRGFLSFDKLALRVTRAHTSSFYILGQLHGYLTLRPLS